MIKNVVATHAGGDPGSFRGNLILFISLNDIKVGKTHLPSNVLDVCREVADLLRQFPQGTVSIVGPGSEGNWQPLDLFPILLNVMLMFWEPRTIPFIVPSTFTTR